MKRGLILVEGPTEERFVKDVLAPHLLPLQFALIPTVIPTKRTFDGTTFKGGLSSFDQIEKAMRLLLHGSGGALVTTMIDYYRLPKNTPGMADRPSGTPERRVRHVELAVTKHFGSPGNLRLHLSLHEFEALLFAGPAELVATLESPRQLAELTEISREFPNPEQINERPDLSPSCRLERLFASYRKRIHGPNAAGRIGLQKLRDACPHFGAWLGDLERHAATA